MRTPRCISDTEVMLSQASQLPHSIEYILRIPGFCIFFTHHPDNSSLLRAGLLILCYHLTLTFRKSAQWP
ncbi:hypothetical protein B7453_03235 [Pseudomonas sp. IB20]|nr:hypothetical protein B7453_03235 [Pseudomonas sp. IB20]